MKQLQQQLQRVIESRIVPPHQRQQRSAAIFDHLVSNSETITRPNFTTISAADLGLLFQINDELFFDGLVGRLCEAKADRPLAFRLSTRMTNAGGTTTMYRSGSRRQPQYEYEIAIATTPLFGTFVDLRSSVSSVVGGVVCHNRVEALQRIMEHEMIHLVEMLLTNDSNCSAAPFKRIVRNFFGHTQSNHQLLRPKDIARQQLGIVVGDTVHFDHHGRQLSGMVNRITKRATILVSDPHGKMYDDGKHYQTYYVPLGRLRKAS